MTDNTLPPGQWAIDTDKTTATVTAKAFLVKSVPSLIRVTSGSIVVSEDGRLASLDVVLDATSVDSGNAKCDDHVKTNDFIDAPAHPHIHLSAGTATRSGGLHIIDASLVVKGNSQPVQLTCSDIEIDESSARFNVTGTVDRNDIGLTKMPSIMIGKTLELDVQAVANRSS